MVRDTCIIVSLMRALKFLVMSLALSLCVQTLRAQDGQNRGIRIESLVLLDASRGRSIPLTTYAASSTPARRRGLAILSHGYGGKNTDYGFIANYLATHGYFVASVQHEIPGDEPLPSTGVPYEVRMPSWERGVQNILFVINTLKASHPEVDYARVLLVGHSHGGDTSMLFAREHASLVHGVVSLDNRRMPLPRTPQPRVLTLRSSDQPADAGVIPSPAELAKSGTTLVRLATTRHDDMWDGGTDEQKAEILRHIDAFLRQQQ